MPILTRPHDGSALQAAGPHLQPGTAASDYTWDPESRQYVFNGQARPGMVYVPSGEYTHSGKQGWVPVADFKNTNGLLHGWTKEQLAAIGTVAAAGAAGPILGAAGVGGGASAVAGGAGADAATSGALASTSLAGAGTLPVAVGGNMAGGAILGGGAMGGAGTAAGIGSKILAGVKGKGAVSTILDTAGKLAPILSGASKSRSAAEQQQNSNQLTADQINQRGAEGNNQAILDKARLDLEQRKFALDAPGTRLNTGVRGSMVANAHNVGVESGAPITLSSGRSISPIHYTGLGPDDLLSPDARKLGNAVLEDQLTSQMAGDKFQDTPIQNVPGASKLNTGGVGDSILGGAAMGTSILGGLASIINKYGKPKPTPTTDDTEMGLL